MSNINNIKRGVDISSHQGNIDLSALKDQIDFVIIRVGFGTNGAIDSKFERNVKLCQSLNIPYGFYWYSYALDVAGAEKEANSFLNAIAPYNPEYGCWFDMEDADGYKKKNRMPSDMVLQNICYKFCEMVENAGYYAGIYASTSWFNNQLAGDKLARFDKWVAKWPTSGGKQKGLDVDPYSVTDLSLWQFTSEGRFHGYRGNLDVNYAYKTFTRPNEQPTPVPEPEPVDPFEGISNEELAERVLAGEFGDGEERKIKLGNRYKAVQAIINKKAKKQEPVENKIIKGSRIRFTGTKSYSGIKLASWTHNDIFNVIELSGDRVVIGKGSAVTAAVNIRDCQKV